MIMLKSTHVAEMNAKDAAYQELIKKLTAERDQLKAALSEMTKARDMWKTVASDVIKQRDELRAEQEQIYTRYQPFMHVTRGPGGRWTSTKQVSA